MWLDGGYVFFFSFLLVAISNEPMTPAHGFGIFFGIFFLYDERNIPHVYKEQQKSNLKKRKHE